MASGNKESNSSEDEEACGIRSCCCKLSDICEESCGESQPENEGRSETKSLAVASGSGILGAEACSKDCSSLSIEKSETHSVIVERQPDATAQPATLNDSSDNEQTEKCAICLSKFSGQDLASPDTCDHSFCLACLQQWAKKVNTCPIDRQKFETILVRHHNTTKIINMISVANKESPNDDEEEDDDLSNCVLCGEDIENTAHVVCDYCWQMYHKRCLFPFHQQVPLPHPFQCPRCYSSTLRDRRVRNFYRFINNQPQLTVPPHLHSSLPPPAHSQNFRESSSSSSLSSEEDAQFLNSASRRMHCLEIRNRRQNRIPRHRDVASAFTPVQMMDSFVSCAYGEDMQYFDVGDGSVMSRVRRRNYPNVKNVLLSCAQMVPNPPRPQVYPSPLSDITGDILHLQPVHHSPGGNGPLINGSGAPAHQHPMGPAHSSPAKYTSSSTSHPNSSFPSSSSGNASSQCKDHLHNSMAVCNLVKSNVNADGFDVDSTCPIAHRSYGLPEDLKRDERETAQSKDANKPQSDEDVDIYSDIDSTNEDETSLDTEIQPVNLGYKSDELHLAPPVADGSDSSDNDLVIDEDRHVEEDDKLKLNKPEDAMSNTDLIMEVNEESCSSEISQEPSTNTGSLQIVENIQSPDDNSQSSSLHDCTDGFKIYTENKADDDEMKVELYNSDDPSMSGNEADEESSLHSLKIGSAVNEEQSQDTNQNDMEDVQENDRLDFDGSASQESEHLQNSDKDFSEETVSHDHEVKRNEAQDGSENDEGMTDDNEEGQESQSEEDSNDKIVTISLEDGDSETSKHALNNAVENEVCNDVELEKEDKPDENALVNIDIHCNLSSSQCDDSVSSYSKVESDNCAMDCSNEKTFINSNELGSNVCNLENESASEEEENDINSDKELHESTGGSFLENTNGSVEDSKPEGANTLELDVSKNVDDLGIEDISDVASDELNRPDSSMDCYHYQSEAPQEVVDEVEKNIAQLFSNSPTEPVDQTTDKLSKGSVDEKKRHSSSSRQSTQDDQEEGEIVEDLPYCKKDSRQGYLSHEEEDFMDSAPRVNISDLPRIPKIKRDSTKVSEPEEPPLEVKRTSVLGRVDLGNSDISWKRLSQHTRERSYRDGRPKDESVLFREREPRQKERKSKNEDRYRDSEWSKKDDGKKQESSKARERNEKNSRERKSDRQKSDYDKNSSRQNEKIYSSSDKREKDKHGKSHDRSKQDKYDRDQPKSERESSKKKDKRDKHKDKSSRDDDKYDRDKRAEEKYKRDPERYEFTADRYERCYEKTKDKEHKYKHKDHRESREQKLEGNTSKKSKDEKRRRDHSNENYSERLKEREVRKVDDKLKIVVEHKEMKKDKGEKHFDKKHDKKHREATHHHHEKKKKETITSAYSDATPTPIESKEIFAKGDSIIINVNFNRSSPREVISTGTDDMFSRDKKANLLHLSQGDNATFVEDGSKSKLSLLDKESLYTEPVVIKRPSTPEEMMEKSPDANSFWQDGDEAISNSPQAEKCLTEKNCSDEDNSNPVENYGDDPLSDSDESDNLSETKPAVRKDDEKFLDVSASDKPSSDSVYLEDKESDSFTISRRRSPQPPSPPSPADNDSYDPCEPTRSPSPPISPPPVPPPLPSKNSMDQPKPPPSPELPPLPPGPEPTDIIPRDDHRLVKNSMSCQTIEVTSVSNPVVTQLAAAYTQTTTAESSVPNVLMPPPSFPPRSTSIQPQVIPPKTVNWQVPNPPAPLMFSPNHVHSVIRGNFLPSHMPRMSMPPQNVSSAILPPTNSIPLMTQVRQLQLSHGVMQSNPLMANVPLNIPQLQMPHLNHPATNSIPSPHQMASLQSHPSSLSAPGVRGMLIQGQMPNIAVTIPNQHVATVLQNQTMGQFIPPQTQVQTQASALKAEKLQKSPVKEKSEVIDMDVDSPYSPGDSPSMDSNYDYSPPSSPVQKTPDLSDNKDPFDTLLGPEKHCASQDNRVANKTAGKSRAPVSSDTPSKKAKLESKPESSTKSRHSVRLQVTDKAKVRKEQKSSDVKDILSKMDDTQLKILDDLPSSAVEMQVKEKFLKKLNRQERVVEEVKLVLKPFYKTREVNKEEYKDILRKSVPKICHNKSGDINPSKVRHLVESYVKKMKHARKKSSKRHKASKYS